MNQKKTYRNVYLICMWAIKLYIFYTTIIMCMKDEKMQKGIRNVIFRSLFAHLTTMAASKLDQRGPPIREHMNRTFQDIKEASQVPPKNDLRCPSIYHSLSLRQAYSIYTSISVSAIFLCHLVTVCVLYEAQSYCINKSKEGIIKGSQNKKHCKDKLIRIA